MKLDHTTLKGTYTAIVTPFTADCSKVCYESLSGLLEFQLKSGVDGIVVCGSTGEAATLTDTEYREVIAFTVKACRGKVPVIAGINTSATRRGAEMARLVEELGVDAILLVAPPYNKPSQEGIALHFSEIKKSTRLPIVAYNIPGRAVANILPQTVARMVNEGTIVGLKDATGSLDQNLDMLALCGDRMALLSGEDSMVHALMAEGGRGVISATANIIPEIFVRITSLALKGDWEASRRAQFEALPVVRSMFIETNPVPVKAALAARGIIRSGAVRLPLTNALDSTLARVKSVLGI